MNVSKIKPIAKRIGIWLLKLAISVFVAWVCSLQLVPLATAERGYSGAYGSEWFLIIGAGALTYYLLSAKRRNASWKNSSNR